MKDFVVYHNPDQMGYAATEVKSLSVLTNKKVGDIVGDRVWLLTGEGKPRRYYLVLQFVIVSIHSGKADGFLTRVDGTHGKIFESAIEIGLETWFPEFKKSQGNFAWGFQPISQPSVVDRLEDIAGVS